MNESGCLLIFSGGKADSTTVNSAGSLYVSSGGTANGITVDTNGCLYVSSGGTATDIIAAGGAGLRIAVASGTYIQGTSDGSAFEIKDAFVANYTVTQGWLTVSTAVWRKTPS